MEKSAGNQAKDADHGTAEEHAQSSGGADKGKSKPESSIDKIVSKLSQQIDEFSKASKSVRVLTETVKTLQQDVNALKRKQPDEEQPNNKKHCGDQEQPGTSTGTTTEQGANATDQEEDESSDELEDFMAESQGDESDEQDQDFAELEEFFQQDDGTGENIGDKMAEIAQNALRGPKNKTDDERLQTLVKKHLRPKNVTNLQVPKVDEYLWSQLRRGVKRVDYMQQKTVNSYGQAITPLLKAMELMREKREPEKVRGYIMDAFKMLCLNVKSTNLERMENIKKELNPKYKCLVPDQPSTSKILGDSFQEAVKKVDGAKSSLTSSSQHFLGKKRGDRYQSSQGYKPRYPYNNKNYKNNQKSGFQYNQNNKAKNQNYNKKTHQSRK